jgi:hypothetical protein
VSAFGSGSGFRRKEFQPGLAPTCGLRSSCDCNIEFPDFNASQCVSGATIFEEAPLAFIAGHWRIHGDTEMLKIDLEV